VLITPASALCQDLQSLFKTSQAAIDERVLISDGSGNLLEVTDSISPLTTIAGTASSVLPQSVKQSCDGTKPLPPFSLTLAPSAGLDNEPNALSVPWHVVLVGEDTAGQPWAAAKPTDGVIPPGGTAQVTITPTSTLCEDLLKASGPVTEQVVVTYDGGKVFVVNDSIAPPSP
jgi:hypothetical protein